MPFAQWGYPHRGQEQFEGRYPADFICEAIDQTRGWFYTLMAIGTLVFDQNSFKNVVCLGHILDEDGRKMSKHLGNVLQPIPLMDEHGADAVRWFMLASGSPWQGRRVGHAAIGDVVRKTLLTYWNTVSFQSLYARTAGWQPSDAAPAPADRPALDRWVLSEAHQLAREVDDALDGFDTQSAGKAIAAFIDDLSNWYVRRSRRRFWDGDPAALSTLHEALRIVTLCMAPFTPFITERVWQDLFESTDPHAPESVHLASWPTVDEALIDPQLSEHMALVRRLVELGRAARASSGVRTRQPLSRALVGATGWHGLPADLRAEISAELNVESLEGLGDSALVHVAVKPNFRALGKRFGKQTQLVATAIGDAEPDALVAAMRAGAASVDAAELGVVSLEEDDLIITETPQEGWAVATGAGETVALDLEITPALRRAGTAREVIRALQEARKTSGLDVSDRIRVMWEATEDDVAESVTEHATAIAEEVLAVEFEQGSGAGEPSIDESGLRAWIARV
jgi:isoleucyl-tRNA synthetase